MEEAVAYEHRSTAQSELRETLEATHSRLDHEFETLLARCTMGEPEGVRAAFDVLDCELRTHMNMEEELMFPLFELEANSDAAALRAEHNRIRSRLDQLGVDLDLHSLSKGCVEAFIALLRQHAQREGLFLYPWLDSRLLKRSRARILDRLRASRPPAAPAGTTAQR